MAIKRGKFVVGSIGTAVYKVVKGRQILQSAPGKGGVRQTEATKESAGLFGKSSGLAKSIRSTMSPVINSYYDGTMIFRLTTAVSAIVRHNYNPKTLAYTFTSESFDSLNGFEFNVNSPLKKYLWSIPQSQFFDNVLTVTLPEIQINEGLEFPKNATNCVLKISIGILNLEEGLYYTTQNFRKVEINDNQGIQEQQQFSFQVPPGCLCIACVALDYYKMVGNLAIASNHKAFNPSAIFATYLNIGTFNPEKPIQWTFNHKAVIK
ncbi:hypothetical protein [Pedobacter sp. L105]|uniref:hypothetical protein n=1 Tax=Pedobacter sp. L105 TaxID=1641871 RepID=UPI00131D3979|nr:hypothetical protein [Pedobacter sp. L105]